MPGRHCNVFFETGSTGQIDRQGIAARLFVPPHGRA
jgi:hypothetical protein